MNAACLFTISAPSGAGKTSLIKALLAKKPDAVVVSVPEHVHAFATLPLLALGVCDLGS